jgi:hypothetical protein
VVLAENQRKIAVAGGEEEEKKYQRGRGLRRLLGEEIDLGFQVLLLSNLFFSFLFFFCFLIAFLKIFLYAPSLCVFFQPSLNHWTFVLSLLLYPLIISMSSKYLSFAPSVGCDPSQGFYGKNILSSSKWDYKGYNL